MYEISALKQAASDVRARRDERVARNSQPLELDDEYRALFARMATVSLANAAGLGYCLEPREKNVLCTYLFTEANPAEKDVLGAALLEDLETERDASLIETIYHKSLAHYRDDALRTFFDNSIRCSTYVEYISGKYRFNPAGLLSAMSHGNAPEFLTDTAGRIINRTVVAKDTTQATQQAGQEATTQADQEATQAGQEAAQAGQAATQADQEATRIGQEATQADQKTSTKPAQSDNSRENYSDTLKSFGLEESTELYETCMELFVLICNAKEYRRIGVTELTATAEKFSNEHKIRLLRNMLTVMDDFQLQDFVPMIDIFTKVTGLKGSDSYSYALAGLDSSCTDKYELWICKYNIEKVLGDGPIARFWYDYATDAGITTTDMPQDTLFIDFKTFGIIEIRDNEAAYFYNSEYIKETVSVGLSACENGEELEKWLHDCTEWSASKEHAAHWRKAHAGQWQLAFREYIAEFREHEVPAASENEETEPKT